MKRRMLSRGLRRQLLAFAFGLALALLLVIVPASLMAGEIVGIEHLPWCIWGVVVGCFMFDAPR